MYLDITFTSTYSNNKFIISWFPTVSKVPSQFTSIFEWMCENELVCEEAKRHGLDGAYEMYKLMRRSYLNFSRTNYARIAEAFVR